jgi:hypothetical protein
MTSFCLCYFFGITGETVADRKRSPSLYSDCSCYMNTKRYTQFPVYKPPYVSFINYISVKYKQQNNAQ